MPTCIAFASLGAVNELDSRVGGPTGFWIIAWLWINFWATYVLGVFDGKLTLLEKRPADVLRHTAQFLALQTLIVPSLFFAGYLLFMAILSIAP